LKSRICLEGGAEIDAAHSAHVDIGEDKVRGLNIKKLRGNGSPRRDDEEET
jgi:hypothetical protein